MHEYTLFQRESETEDQFEDRVRRICKDAPVLAIQFMPDNIGSKERCKVKSFSPIEFLEVLSDGTTN